MIDLLFLITFSFERTFLTYFWTKCDSLGWDFNWTDTFFKLPLTWSNRSLYYLLNLTLFLNTCLSPASKLLALVKKEDLWLERVLCGLLIDFTMLIPALE